MLQSTPPHCFLGPAKRENLRMEKKKPHLLRILRDLGLALLLLAIATAIGLGFQHLEFHKTNIVVLYIFSVLLIARFSKGYLWGILASVISILLFNWFFTEPYFTLKVDDPTYLITFAIMALTAIFTSALTTKAKQSAEEARERENESNALYRVTNHLTDAEDMEAIAEVTVHSVSEVLGCPSAFIGFDEQGTPESTFTQRREDGSIIRRELDGAEELRRRMELLHGSVEVTERDYDFPIYGKAAILAVLRIPREAGEAITPSQTRMLHSIMESAALALERLRSLRAQAKSREETTQERYRANLLRAISHDIRTPLSGMMGTSEILMSKTEQTDPRYAMARDIYTDALWLHGLVENILNLTKLQDGRLTLVKQPEAVEEVIAAALMVMEKRLPDRTVQVEIPDNVVIVPMDAKLISQVLVNLLDNAAKHTPIDAEISISVVSERESVRITVADRGSGIPERDLPYIFQMFYTTAGKSPDAKRGVGLGLAICQSIVEAHGGSIRAENRKGGGAAFIFTLPMGGDSV